MVLIKKIIELFKQSSILMEKENIWEILIIQNRLFFYHIAVIIIFSFIYYFSSEYYGTNNDKKKFKNFLDSFYFTTITHFTVGFGDIVPESKFLKIFVIIQVLIAFILMNR